MAISIYKQRNMEKNYNIPHKMVGRKDHVFDENPELLCDNGHQPDTLKETKCVDRWKGKMNDSDQSFGAIQLVMPLFPRKIIKSVLSFLFVERVAQTCRISKAPQR